MKAITLETLYEKMLHVERELLQLKKKLTEEPELRDEFIRRMRDIDQEESVIVKDFGRRYGVR